MDKKQWIDDAAIFFAKYALNKAQGYTFLAEDVKTFAQETGFPEPNDPRNWGLAARKARRDGLVSVVGFASAKTSNGSPKCLWRAHG